MDIYGAGLAIEWETSNGMFKSVTGYREVDSSFISDMDGDAESDFSE